MFGRLQQHVGVLVITQFAASLTDDRGEPLLLVKGGASMELRKGIPQSRLSKDLDTVILGEIEGIHDRLADAGEIGWEGFNAVFTPPVPFEVPGLAIQPHRFTAKLTYRAKPFVSVPIEASPVEAGNADGYDQIRSEALNLVGLPNGDAVPCMTLPWQIAQKIHACTDHGDGPRINDRAHDLVDLQLLEALMVDETLGATQTACQAVFAARGKHDWPPTVVALPHWGPLYSRALEGLAGLGMATDINEAVERTRLFIRRIDDFDFA